jgi:hypothetical protein
LERADLNRRDPTADTVSSIASFPQNIFGSELKFPSGTTSGLIDLTNLTDHFKELLTESPDMFSGKSVSPNLVEEGA